MQKVVKNTHKTNAYKNNPHTLVFSFNIIPSNERNLTRSNTCTVDLPTDPKKSTYKIIHKTQQEEGISCVTGINDWTGCCTRCSDRVELFKVQN